MSYIVIKIYSFECDETGCHAVAEISGEGGLRASETALCVYEYWTVNKSGRHFCREHKPQEGSQP